MFLVISNISKRANVRQLLAVAAAFRCKGVYVVGQPKLDIGGGSGSGGAAAEGASGGSIGVPPAVGEQIRSRNLAVHRFRKWDECVEHLERHNIQIVGVEIHRDAKTIDEFLDGVAASAAAGTREGGRPAGVAFLMGNEGQGLSEKQMKSCDGGFVRIPQYGGGTASLNVYVAASIVLHRYHEWQQQQKQKQHHREIDLPSNSNASTVE